jgi:type IV secretory pathway component VirB8
MQQQVNNLPSKEEEKEHYEFIKAAVNDGSFFKDGLNWYFFRYVNPFCERTIFFIISILTSLMLYLLVQMIESCYPLVQKVPIIIPSLDQSKYFPYLIQLKPKDDLSIKSVDEAVAKYLIKKYIKNRENHDYKKAEIEPITIKFNQIRNTSSPAEYRAFQNFMSKNNPTSPILDFSKDAYRHVEIDSVTFIRNEPQTFANKAIDFLTTPIPTDAEIRYILISKKENEDEIQQKYLVKMNFTFLGVVRPNDNNKLDTSFLKFIVNSYKTYIIS